jgi:hypothetical protein
MAQTRADVFARLTSLCAGDPFRLIRAVSPFDFDVQPTGQIDQVFRITAQTQDVIGGFNYTEERTDLFTIWVARKQNAEPHTAYALLIRDVSSLTSAIIHDGCTGGGDFHVPDGGEATIQHDDGQEFAVARLALPINYEAQV